MRQALGHHWVGLILMPLLCASSCDEDLPAGHQAFLDLPRDERRVAIKNYPPEEQLNLYVLAMLKKHPPDLGLASAVASTGQRVLPALIRRIETEQRGVVFTDLLYILVTMKEEKYLDVAADEDTVSRLERAVFSMRDVEWKGKVLEYLERIKERQGTPDE